MQDTTLPNQNRGLTILKLLWQRFLIQSWQYKIITVVVIALTLVWMIIFYSSYLIFKIISLVITKPLLYSVEWYLLKTQKPLAKEEHNG